MSQALLAIQNITSLIDLEKQSILRPLVMKK